LPNLQTPCIGLINRYISYVRHGYLITVGIAERF